MLNVSNLPFVKIKYGIVPVPIFGVVAYRVARGQNGQLVTTVVKNPLLAVVSAVFNVVQMMK